MIKTLTLLFNGLQSIQHNLFVLSHSTKKDNMSYVIQWLLSKGAMWSFEILLFCKLFLNMASREII